MHKLVGLGVLLLCVVPHVARTAEPDAAKLPAVGDRAADFTLESLGGGKVTLSKLTDQGPVVLIVLRGWPGYQCPICSRQVGQFLGEAKAFRQRGANVVFVYPGPQEDLGKYAREFIAGKSLPEGYHFVTDPDFKFTKAYHLRWNAPRETAYPSTFVIGQDNKIRFAKVSTTHGGRAAASQVLQAVPKPE